MIHEARIVAERVGDVLELGLGLVVPAHAHAVVTDQIVQLEHELENLVHRDLQSVISGAS